MGTHVVDDIPGYDCLPVISEGFVVVDYGESQMISPRSDENVASFSIHSVQKNLRFSHPLLKEGFPHVSL